mgnify:CR=1 FL=1|jgi:hypothetical protein
MNNYIMATKSEIEEDLNERLNMDIEWSELKKDDLKTIEEGLDDEEFIKKFVAQYANTVAGDKVQGKVENWKPGEGLKLLAQMQEGKANPMDFFM